MKALLILLVVLSIAAWVGMGLQQDPGMLVVTIANWRVDMPLWLAILIFVLFMFVVSVVFKLLKSIFSVPGFIAKYSEKHHKKQAKQLTHKGLIALAEGNWTKAEKLLIKGVPYNEMPWINYVSAAKAAQHAQHYNKRDTYLFKAHDTLPEGEIAVGLTKAQLQLEHNELTQSLDTLKMLQHKAPHHPYILKMLQKIYMQNQNWTGALALLPEIKKSNVYPATELNRIEFKIYKAMLIQSKKENIQVLADIWHKIPKDLRQNGDLAFIYARALHKKHNPQEAEEVIRAALKKHWREDLILLYGNLAHPQPEKLFGFAEDWLSNHAQSPGLLLTLGRLCEKMQLWGKAQRYYEASLALEPSPQAYFALGLLLEAMNEGKTGTQYYKKGLMLAQPHFSNAQKQPN